MTLAIEPPPFQSSGELPIFDPERASDIEQKHERITQFLKDQQFDALLLQRPSNLAWFTSGMDFTRGGSSETIGSLFIASDARVVLSNNVDSSWFFEGPLAGLGFQLKERPWHEPPNVLVDDLCRGRRMASDSAFGRSTDVSSALRDLRCSLNRLECDRVRELGLVVAHAVEATARQLQPGTSESEIAGALANRLVKRGVIPERLQVCADGISSRFRHWVGNDRVVERTCTLTAVGRRDGLHAAATRTVCLGDVPDELRSAFQLALMVQATGMYFSQSGWPISSVWPRVTRILEKFGRPHEWELADQADVLGYEPCETRIGPGNPFVLRAGSVLFWHPTVNSAAVGDTMLIGEMGLEILTPTEQWPLVKVDVKGTPIFRPGILSRP